MIYGKIGETLLRPGGIVLVSSPCHGMIEHHDYGPSGSGHQCYHFGRRREMIPSEAWIAPIRDQYKGPARMEQW